MGKEVKDMKNKLKDPRPTLRLLLRLSMGILIVSVIYIPLFLSSVQKGNYNRLYFLLLFLVVGFLLYKFYFKEKHDEYQLHVAVRFSYFYSVSWLLLGLMGIFVSILEFNITGLTIITLIEIFITAALLLVSFALFYLGNKSRKYEKLKN